MAEIVLPSATYDAISRSDKFRLFILAVSSAEVWLPPNTSVTSWNEDMSNVMKFERVSSIDQ